MEERRFERRVKAVKMTGFSPGEPSRSIRNRRFSEILSIGRNYTIEVKLNETRQI